MMMKNDEEYSQQNIIQAIQQDMFLHQQQQMQQQLQQNGDVYGTSGRGLNNIFPSSEVLQPWPLPPAVHSLNPAHFISNPVQDDPFLVHYPTSSSYGSLFNRDSNRDPSLHFSYDGSTSNQLRIISDSLGPDVHQPGSAVPFGLQHELGKMNAQEIMDAKALAASKSHSEAERRRRERINKHLAKLRSLLPNTTKTDKASLLAEVIEHVKELKRQTCLISETSSVPTETDELRVDEASDEEGRFFIKASICCEDRSDLLPDLIKTLKELRLTPVKAEITTIDGRVRSVLFITADEEDSSCSYYNINNNIGDHNQQQQQQTQQYCISSIHEALKVVMEKTGSGDNDTSTSGNSKRQGSNNIDILGT